MGFSKNIVKTIAKQAKRKEQINDSLLLDIGAALEEIRYGSVHIHIQDGKIIQIDKVNKIRVC